MTPFGFTRQLLLLATLVSPTLAFAQPARPPGDGPAPARGPEDGPGRGPGDERRGNPGAAIMAALDTNGDGQLSPEEIRNAPAALKALDHNHDGSLDRSELAPRDGRPGQAGAADGPPRNRRLGGPPRDAADAPPDAPPPPREGRGRPAIGHVLPPFVRDELALSDRQRKQITALESDVKGKLESILTAAQLRQVRDLLERGPGGPGGRGPGNGPGQGERPGAGPPDENEGPPVRPQRPRQP